MAATVNLEFEIKAPTNRVSNGTSELETALRRLLDVADEAHGHDSGADDDVKRRLTFELCVDGHIYRVSIVQFHHLVESLRPQLSPREKEIAHLISKGLPNKAIAARLRLRPCTVNTYTKRIFLKLNVNSRAEMVAKVLNTGLLNTHLM